jgi:CRP/FNR family transcriptional regulator
LLQILAELLEHHGEPQDDGVHNITLPVSRRDLASMIGTRHETLSRLMSRIEDDRLATFSGRTVVIPNLDAFVKAAYQA